MEMMDHGTLIYIYIYLNIHIFMHIDDVYVKIDYAEANTPHTPHAFGSFSTPARSQIL